MIGTVIVCSRTVLSALKTALGVTARPKEEIGGGGKHTLRLLSKKMLVFFFFFLKERSSRKRFRFKTSAEAERRSPAMV